LVLAGKLEIKVTGFESLRARRTVFYLLKDGVLYEYGNRYGTPTRFSIVSTSANSGITTKPQYRRIPTGTGGSLIFADRCAPFHR
jgi:hypothetical protein